MHGHPKNNNHFAVIAVYDVTRRETFTNLSDIWAKEVGLYCTNNDCVKMLVGNKVDVVSFYSFYKSVYGSLKSFSEGSPVIQLNSHFINLTLAVS